MLEFIRSRARGWFAWVIVGMIIIPFALWGVHQYVGGGGDTSVAKVGGAEISQTQLQNAYMQQRQRLQEMFGGTLPPMFSDEMIRSQVLEQLIEQEMLVQAARDNGMRIGDSTLAQTITSIDAFQEDGRFSNTRYQQLLRAQGMMPGMFEQRVRRDMLAAQFTDGVSATSFITDAEVDNYLRLQLQQRSIGYLTVASEKFKDDVEVSDAEIENYYQEHAQQYMQPERVKVDYLELNTEDLAGNITVDEAAMRERYESRKINYATEEQRKASHILVQVPAGAGDEQVNAQRNKAENILARIRQGEDFALLARTESDDPGSAEQGGDLGFLGKGLDPAFEEAVFALKKGEVSELVRSSFGFHIIKLTDIEGGEVKSFDEVKAELRKEIQMERAEQQYYDMAEQLANLTYEHPESLSVAAEQLQLPIKTTPFFTRDGGAGITAEPKVISAAFGEEILARGNNSETIELGRNHMVVLRLNEHLPEAQRPLEEVRAGIVSALKSDKARNRTEELAAALRERVRSGEQPAELAKTLGITWNSKQSVTRDAAEVDRAVSAEAFRMPRPAQGEQVTRKLALPSGDQAVIILYSVEEGDPAEAGEAQRRQAATRLQQAAANTALSSVVSGIRNSTDINIRK
jgi:peptidyl-prolyl cis-trans isomerase D